MCCFYNELIYELFSILYLLFINDCCKQRTCIVNKKYIMQSKTESIKTLSYSFESNFALFISIFFYFIFQILFDFIFVLSLKDSIPFQIVFSSSRSLLGICFLLEKRRCISIGVHGC